VIVRVNGEKKEIGAGLTVAQLLGELAARVVVELNRDVLSREAHGTTILKDGDQIEIVQFVGGG
jgi:sulfur carrier protein